MSQKNPWDNDPIVENGKAMPDGSVVFNLPPNPADIAKERREQRRLELAEAAEDRAAAKAAAELNLTPAQKAIDTKFAPDYVEWAVSGGRSDFQKGRAQLQDSLNALRSGADLTGPITGNIPEFIQQFTNPDAISTREAVEEVVQRNLRLILGAQFTEKEGERLIARAYNPRLSEAENAKRVGRLLRQMEKSAETKEDAARYYEQNGTLAGWQGSLPTMALMESSIDDPLLDQAPAGGEGQQSPLSGPSPERTEVSGSGPMFTAQDREMQARLQQAYSQGANLQQLQAIAAEYNRQFPIGTQQELDAARAAGRQISVEPSGQRTAAQEAIGQVADSPVGAAFVGASNALLSGGLDELAPLMGLDPETVQAAKEMLREKYPVSSFAGEVAGQVGQLAAGGAGIRALGGGVRALGAAEVAQGALYGAGESNENRLMGAALGGGAALAGQQLAQRFLTPAVSRKVDEIAAQSGAPREQVEQVISEAVEGAQTRIPRVAAVDDVAPTPMAPEVQTEVGNLARQAIGSGRPAREAQEKLAIMAKIDPEAKAAAERLGMDLTPDILSDDTRLLTVTGLARSQVGSEAETAWINTARQTIEKADDAMAQVGASRNLAGVSQEVRTTLQSSMDELERGATALRDEVNAAINVRDRVDAGNLQSALAQTINDLGGIAEAKAAMSSEEKKLLAMLGEGEVARQPTYAMLERVRDQIGEAIFKNKGPWVDTDTATLKRYYGALAQDRLDYVAAKGGQELADKMRGSNDLYSKMYDVRGTMQTLFGKQLESDISGLITQAVTSGAKGQGKALRTILSNVPEELQAQTLLTGLMSAAGRSGPNGGFSFTKYAQVYRGLRENAPIYSEIAKTIGPDASQVLQDLYAISKRMARAENAVIKTGKANQPLINALNAESLVSNVAKGAMRRGAITGGTAMAGGVAGGPVGAVVGGAIADALQKTATQAGKTSLDRLHGVLTSEPFKELVEKVGTGDVPQSAVNKVASDSAFRKFAKALGLNTFEQRKNWLQSSIVAGAATQSRPEPQPTSVIEVR